MLEIYYVPVILAIILSVGACILDYLAGLKPKLLEGIPVLLACFIPIFNVIIIVVALTYIFGGL